MKKRITAAALVCAMILTIVPTVNAAKVRKPKLAKSSLTLVEGEAEKLTVAKNKNSVTSIKWTSSSKSKVTVKKKGKLSAIVTAKAKGSAIVKATVRYKNGKKTSSVTLKCKVSVDSFSKNYTISEKSGTYKESVKPVVKAKKGYNVYYTTDGKFKAENVIKSEKSKTFSFVKTAKLMLLSVKKNRTPGTALLNANTDKAESFIYTITAKRSMVFKDGLAQQTVKYSTGQDLSYKNEDSDIIRYIVYVETDHDTDLDGKRDLIKAVVQVPRAAAEGDYKAGTIFEARPYCAGETMAGYFFNIENESDFDESKMFNSPEARKPEGSMTTMQAAQKADPSDWYYQFDNDGEDIKGKWFYNNLPNYDYFLVRGFAVVASAGLGTYGSEGMECCATTLEADTFKNVVEWLHGDRIAYTDKKNNIEIKADWSNGKVGMTGRSYAGTMPYEVATTGVKGLETVVPVAGIANWYEYTNTQGATYLPIWDYTSTLAGFCFSRLFDDTISRKLAKQADSYLSYLNSEQIRMQGAHGEYWNNRDFSRTDKIKASMLVVQGLNDENVKPKQMDLMYKAAKRSGANVKILLHQNGHITPANENEKWEIKIGGETYDDILNRWFSHYLYGVDNGAENRPEVTAQSNVDGNFYYYDSWESDEKLQLKPKTNGEKNVDAKTAYRGNQNLFDKVYVGSETANSALWSKDITEDTTIKGAIKVHVRAKISDASVKNPHMSAVLVDRADDDFKCFNYAQYEFVLPINIIEKGGISRGDGVEPYDLAEFEQSIARKKIISTGTLNLKRPDADYMPYTAVDPKEPIKSGEYYDYNIWLQPNLYTVKAGHHLELYVVPFIYMSDPMYIDPEEEEEEDEEDEEKEANYSKPDDSAPPYANITLSDNSNLFDGPEYVKYDTEYSFTIDNSQSFADIPVTYTKGTPLK